MADEIDEIKRVQAERAKNLKERMLRRRKLSDEDEDEAEDEDDDMSMDVDDGIAEQTNGTNASRRRLVDQYTVSQEFVDELASEDYDPLAGREKARTIYERQSEYQKKRLNRTVDDAEKSYKEIMEERELEREEKRVHDLIEKQKEEAMVQADGSGNKTPSRDKTPPGVKTPPRKRRWDVERQEDKENIEKKKSQWDQQPEEPAPPAVPEKKRRSRWDQAPEPLEEPTKSQAQSGLRILTEAMIDELLPKTGYMVLPPPPGYVPLRQATKPSAEGFVMLEDVSQLSLAAMEKDIPGDIADVGELQFFKKSDHKYFAKIMGKQPDESILTFDEMKERKVMRLILRIKNGTPAIRKGAMRQITENARVFGPKILFNQILPLLMEPSLEDQERHLLVKVIDRVLYKLGDLVRPYTHKILVVIEPLLIDEDRFARLEAREIISNLSKAAGLQQMMITMRPDIDHADEYVRNTTARSFAVVASALGIPSLLPFFKAVCKSKKSWQARHTGVKIIQQIALLMGCAILPHLKGLVECVGEGLNDEQPKVRMMTAHSLAALAEAATPYGIESFESVLEPLWMGVRRQRGKGLVALLKCIGFVIPLMDPEYANYYTREVMKIVVREFSSPDVDMKKTVLKVVQQCTSTEGVTPQYLREEVLPSFFKSFWVRRMALDKRNYRLVVETTVELSQKVGATEILERIVDYLKDETESFRKMAVETVDKVITILGAADISERLEERLVDGILVAFQEQTLEDPVVLNGFGTVVNALGYRTKPYIPQIVSTILFRLSNQSPAVRQQAADLITRIATVMKVCNEDALMGKLCNILYEQLGEEYPEVLGSILGAMRSIVTVVGLSSMQPPIRDLLPRLTPILRNRQEKVQENAIDLVGRIADRGAEYVSAREWMRICFELLDMLKAHKKGIRRAANNTFGYIAKAIGPQDVLATLLSNLRVQERQLRVCTAVAIAIVAETCAPFTVLPAVMNEYRVPDINVQNGVLKALAFLFEYIGDMAKDYVYAVTPLIEDALIDRDQVHRQTAATVVKHLALGCIGTGCEDAMVHFLNLLLPNIFETSPHVIDRVLEGIDGVRNAIGTGIAMNYVWAGLFQAARKVRIPYWRMYNTAYVQSADALIPYYPDLPEGRYKRHELDIWI